MDHDISLLIPEIWARLDKDERDPVKLYEQGYLEKLQDFEFDGRVVEQSRLGYRITERFIAAFLGKIFDNPAVVFDEKILKPELQDMAVYIDGIDNIVEAQQRVAQQYLDDGSIEDACPPLKALLTIMATGEYQGMTIHHPDIRALFDRDAMLQSDWYKARLEVKQQIDIKLWKKHCKNLQKFLTLKGHEDLAETLDIQGRLDEAKRQLQKVSRDDYIDSLKGTIGADSLLWES